MTSAVSSGFSCLASGGRDCPEASAIQEAHSIPANRETIRFIGLLLCREGNQSAYRTVFRCRGIAPAASILRIDSLVNSALGASPPITNIRIEALFFGPLV